MTEPGGGVDAFAASIRAAIDAAHPSEPVEAGAEPGSEVEFEPRPGAAPVDDAAPIGPRVPKPTSSNPTVSTEGLLADGVYRDLTVGRWTRLALATFAFIAVFAAAAVSSSTVAVLVLSAIAVVLIAVRSILRRPRLVVRAEGLTVVRRLGSSTVGWAEVVSAGGVPAPPPLAKIERVLAVRVTDGRELRVPSLRDAVDRRTGDAPRVVELAAALVARAEWAIAPR